MEVSELSKLSKRSEVADGRRCPPEIRLEAWGCEKLSHKVGDPEYIHGKRSALEDREVKINKNPSSSNSNLLGTYASVGVHGGLVANRVATINPQAPGRSRARGPSISRPMSPEMAMTRSHGRVRLPRRPPGAGSSYPASEPSKLVGRAWLVLPSLETPRHTRERANASLGLSSNVTRGTVRVRESVRERGIERPAPQCRNGVPEPSVASEGNEGAVSGKPLEGAKIKGMCRVPRVERLGAYHRRGMPSALEWRARPAR